jgi:hypothetical protein
VRQTYGHLDVMPLLEVICVMIEGSRARSARELELWVETYIDLGVDRFELSAPTLRGILDPDLWTP